MKYIMFIKKEQGLTRKIPIIFPESLAHIDVAKALSNLTGTSKICSAGTVDLIVEGVHGKSTSIGIGSHIEDIDIIESFDYKFGIEC